VSKRRVLIVAALALLSLTACSTGQPSPPAGTSTTTSQAPGSVAQQVPAPTVQAPGSATKQIPVPGGAPESTLAGTGIHIVSARSHVTDDVALSPGQCHVKAVDATSGKFLPDPSCTPGAVDPGVTQSNLAQTICRSGYSSSVRAPAAETGKAKTVSLTQYGEQSTKTTEYDHLISLELGGTNATSNLWPEPNAAAATGTTNPKDSVENKMHDAVCSGTITLVAAQKAIAADWTTALAAVHR
jgi:hypothetical protein